MTREYWRKHLTITALLLACWLALTVGVGYYAGELHDITALRFPFAFYLAAQGALVLYVVIIGCYAWYVRKQDRIYGARKADGEPYSG
jgi:putative solute:sodium symporter small subunit